MVGRLEFAPLFHRSMRDSKQALPSPPSWPWPSCKHPSSHSFRKVDEKGNNATCSSSYFELSESCFSNSSAAESESFSTASEASAGDAAEAIIRGLRSDRLLYEPAGSTSSIIADTTAAAKAESSTTSPFEGSVAMAVDSKDPYMDFKESMEEMVMAHGAKSWEWLEEMLGWYLKANEKSSHGIIVGAFVDLLLGLASPSSCSSSCSSFSLEIKEEDLQNGLS